MSELSKRMRSLRERATRGDWEFFNEDDDHFMNAFGVSCRSDDVSKHHNDEPDHGDIDPNTAICLTLLQAPRACDHRSGKWEANAEFIAAAANEMTALCDEVERLEAENARLKLVAENAPLLDSMGRGVGNPLDRLENENAALKVENAEMRAKLATDPKSHQPEDQAK